jgi:CheY-like chemotaxis protein
MIRRILLADDDADDRELFEEVFADLPSDQYQLNCVNNGIEVIDFLRSINNPYHLPDLIILDQKMPGMSGREVFDILKADEIYRQIPVIIYSTYNDRTFISECKRKGVVAVVSKPVSYEGYIKMINTFLKYTAEFEV